VEALFLLNELKQVIGDAWIGKKPFLVTPRPEWRCIFWLNVT
jgi:hypothetical protein